MLYDADIFDRIEQGWHKLLQDMFEEIEPLVDYSFKIIQIKEKHGELVVQTNEASSEVEEIIEDYAERSRHICEFCGKPGHIRSGPYVRTLCDECDNRTNSFKTFYSCRWIHNASGSIDN